MHDPHCHHQPSVENAFLNCLGGLSIPYGAIALLAYVSSPTDHYYHGPIATHPLLHFLGAVLVAGLIVARMRRKALSR